MRKYLNILLPLAVLALVGCATADGEQNFYEQIGYKTDSYGGEQPDVLPGGGDQFEEFKDNPFVSVNEEPTSTFSVDADGASYAIMRRYVTNGYRINPSSVRIEEFLNYFTFDYPSPTGSVAVAINAEVGDCPWNSGHKLLRLGLKGKELRPDEVPLANFVFLVDVSGSMSTPDKLDLLKSGLIELLGQLQPDDRISLITYSGEVRKLLESTPVREADKIKKAIRKLNAEGSTAGGAALKMAYQEAMANYDPAKNNRIIMGTDGDFNVGVTSTAELVELVEEYARKGIYMTCLGFGAGNLNDAMMEKISNTGNGSYYYIDCEDEMMKVFVHERERFVSVANDTKCQITFNPAYISEYRLIGYENRVMSNEDFEDDTKDAGEIGAGQTITALYEIVPVDFNMIDLPTDTPQHSIATFDVRYKKSLDGQSYPLQREIRLDELFTKQMRSPDYQFAAGVAAYGMILRDSPYKGTATYAMAKDLMGNGLTFDPHGYRAALLKLMEKAERQQTEKE